MNEKPRSADQRLRRRRTLHDDFAGWLRKNRSRLPMRLLVRQRRGDGGRDYRFPDAPDFRVLVDNRGIEVRVVHEGEVFDTLIDLDIEPRRDAAGYYCAWCEDQGHAERFPDRATLLAQHAFEPFAEWCREMLRADKRLVMERNPCGSTTASICDARDVRRRKPPGVTMYVVKPVLCGSTA